MLQDSTYPSSLKLHKLHLNRISHLLSFNFGNNSDLAAADGVSLHPKLLPDGWGVFAHTMINEKE